jgi:hypothetical protein
MRHPAATDEKEQADPDTQAHPAERLSPGQAARRDGPRQAIEAVVHITSLGQPATLADLCAGRFQEGR